MICYIIVFVLLLCGLVAILAGGYFIISSKDLAQGLLATLIFLLAVAYTLGVWNSGQDMVDKCNAKDGKICYKCE